MSSDLRSERLSTALLKPCLLTNLLAGSAHGYELHHRLLSIGVECDLGTVYRSLNTMETEGLLRSTWERSEEGRSRHRFELTEAGEAMVDHYAPAVEQMLRSAEAFLSMRRSCGHNGANGVHPDRNLATLQ